VAIQLDCFVAPQAGLLAMTKRTITGVLLGAATMFSTAANAEQRFTSSETRVSLIELYTSEGCSSCPPAERWLGDLKKASGLWRDFVPVAFHVNYWDRLGWPDRFASREATQRQHAYAAVWGSESVYTPCFVRDGAEWRTSTRALEPSIEKVGILVATISESKTCRVEFRPMKRETAAAFDVYIALLGSGLSSQVTAGENRGELLRHEFVAIGFEKHALGNPGDASPTAEFALPRSQITDGSRRGIAIWITPRGKLAPLQAVGGWLERAPADN
jgi:hypothetical protein